MTKNPPNQTAPSNPSKVSNSDEVPSVIYVKDTNSTYTTALQAYHLRRRKPTSYVASSTLPPPVLSTASESPRNIQDPYSVPMLVLTSLLLLSSLIFEVIRGCDNTPILDVTLPTTTMVTVTRYSTITSPPLATSTETKTMQVALDCTVILEEKTQKIYTTPPTTIAPSCTPTVTENRHEGKVGKDFHAKMSTDARRNIHDPSYQDAEDSTCRDSATRVRSDHINSKEGDGSDAGEIEVTGLDKIRDFLELLFRGVNK